MFRSVKRKIGAGKDKYDFKLEFHATQVPQNGWDKLLVLLMPLETGKIIGKTEKAIVQDGTCQWINSICESAKLFFDEKTKDTGKAMYKLVVSKGSSRSKVLGETCINLGEYVGVDSPTSLALPLQKCDSGTVLHVNILCLSPKFDTRNLEGWMQQENEQIESKIHGDKRDSSQHSEIDVQPSFDESKKENAVCNLNSLEALSRAGEYSEADICVADCDPVSLPTSRNCVSECQNSIDDVVDLRGLSKMENQDVKNIFHSVLPAEMCSSGLIESCQSPHSLNNSDDATFMKAEHDNPFRVNELELKEHFLGVSISLDTEKILSRQLTTSHREITSPVTNLGDEETPVKDLQIEGVSLSSSESNMSAEIERLKKQLDLETRHAIGSESALLALTSERDSMKIEIEQLRSAKHNFQEIKGSLDKVLLELEDAKSTIKELRDEIRYEKSASLSLNLQLQKTQESNSELLLEIKDLEGVLVERNKEIESLKLKLDTHDEDNRKHDILEDSKITLLQSLQAGRKEIHRLGGEIASLHASVRNDESIPDGELEKMILKFMEEFDALESVMQELTTEKSMDLVIQWMQNNAQVNARNNETVHLLFKAPTEPFWLTSGTELDANQTKESNKANNIGSMKGEVTNCPPIDPMDSNMLHSRIAYLERKLKCSEEEVYSLMKKVDAMKGEIDNCEKERSLIASQRGQLKYLREKVAFTEQECKNALKQAEDLEVANMNLEKRMDSVVASLEEQHRKAEEKEHIAVQSCTDAYNKISDLQAENAQLNEHIAELISAKESSEAVIGDLEMLNARLQDSLHQVEISYIEALRQSNEQEGKVAHCFEQLSDSDASAKDLRDKILQHGKNSELLESNVEGSENEGKVNRSYDEIMHAVTRIKSALELTNEDLESQNDKLRNKLHIAENKDQMARQSVEVLVHKIKTLKYQIESSLQHLLSGEQMVDMIASDFSANNDATAKTFFHSEIFQDLEGQLRLMQDMIEHVSAEFSCHVESLNKNYKIMSHKQLELEKSLEKAFKEMDCVMKEYTCCQERLMKLEAECADQEEEKYKLGKEINKLQNEFGLLQNQLEGSRSDLHKTKQEKTEVEAVLQAIRMDNSKLVAEVTSFKEKAVANEETTSRVKQLKNGNDQKSDLVKLRRRIGEFKRKLVEQEEEKEELKKKVYFLGEEVRCKAGALAIAEKKLKEKQKDEMNKTLHATATVSANTRPLPRTKSTSGLVLNSYISRELAGLQARVKLLQDDVTSKKVELESSKKMHEEKEMELCHKIEHFKSINEKLIEAQKNCIDDNPQCES